MYRPNPEFHQNPYVGSVKMKGKQVFLLMSEGGTPAVYNDNTAIFSSADAVRGAYSKHIYRGKKSAPRLQVVDFGDLSSYPSVRGKVQNTLAQYPAKMMDARAIAGAISARKAERAQMQQAANMKAAAKRGGFTYPMIRFVAWNLQPGLGGLGRQAQAAYARASKETNIIAALRAAGISPSQVEKAMNLYIPFVKGKKLSKGQKNSVAVRAARAAGFTYSPVNAPAAQAKAPARGGRRAVDVDVDLDFDLDAPPAPRGRRPAARVPADIDLDFDLDEGMNFDLPTRPSPAAAKPKGRAGRVPADIDLDFDLDEGMNFDLPTRPSKSKSRSESTALARIQPPDVDLDFGLDEGGDADSGLDFDM